MVYIFQVEDVLSRALKAAERLGLYRDNYTNVVSELRGKRESQQISQQEMARRLKTSQGFVSNFEGLHVEVSLDFFISYASAFGYSLIVCDKPLSAITARAVDVAARRRQLISSLLKVKNDIEKAIFREHNADDVPDDAKGYMTYIMAKSFAVPEADVRRFETDINYVPDAYLAFHYADYMGTVLKLSEDLQGENNTKNKYSEFVSVLRSIRETYQVTQEEMGRLMDEDQTAISNLETAKPVTLDFLIFYASLLGYNISVVSSSRSRDEITRFCRRQSQIIKAIRHVNRQRIEEIFYADVHGNGLWPKSIVDNNRSRIISELLRAKKIVGLTTKRLSEELGVSDRTVRRFERAKDYAPSAPLAFKYAALVNVELQLEKILRRKRETLGYFYIRRSLILHNWLRDPPG